MMEIVMCPTCGKFKAVAAGIRRSSCPYCRHSMQLKDLKVFFRSGKMEEITAAMGELNVAFTRGGLFEEDYRRESEIFGELKKDAEAESERRRRGITSAETKKKDQLSVANAVEYALENLDEEGKMPFTPADFTEAMNRKRKMDGEECERLLERLVEEGMLYMPESGLFGLV